MPDDGEDRPGLTWFAMAALLMPTLVIQEFCRILLLPKLGKVWEGVGNVAANEANLLEVVRALLSHSASTLGGMFVLILLLEWLGKPSRRMRGFAAGLLALAYNTSVMLGIVALAVSFALTAPGSRSTPAPVPVPVDPPPVKEAAPVPQPAGA